MKSNHIDNLEVITVLILTIRIFYLLLCLNNNNNTIIFLKTLKVCLSSPSPNELQYAIISPNSYY